MGNLEVPKNKKGGQPFSASQDWNPVLESLRKLNKTQKISKGKMREDFPCKIIDHGPNGEPDYSDCRYWVQREYVNLTNSNTNALLKGAFSNYGDPPSDWIFTGTNLAEIFDNTHLIPLNNHVYVHKTLDLSTPPTYHYYFLQGVCSFWGRLGSASYTIPGKWEYQFEEVDKSDGDVGYVGSGNWTTVVGGISDIAYNVDEEVGNADSAIKSDTIVRIWFTTAKNGTEYWFEHSRATGDHINTSDYVACFVMNLKMDEDGKVRAFQSSYAGSDLGCAWYDLDGNVIG